MEVKRVVAEVAQDCAILNADDLLCLQMAVIQMPAHWVRHHEPAQ